MFVYLFVCLFVCLFGGGDYLFYAFTFLYISNFFLLVSIFGKEKFEKDDFLQNLKNLSTIISFEIYVRKHDFSW